MEQALIFFSADHLIEKTSDFYKVINLHKFNLTENNIYIFGVKPTSPSSDYGYFITKKIKRNINKVTKFIEKPKESKAKQVIKQKGYWNSGIFFLRKDSIINNFKIHQPTIYRNCVTAVNKAKYKFNTYYLNKSSFIKSTSKSFDHAILEKTDHINAIKLDIPWSDLGSWKEILKMFFKNKNRYLKNKIVFNRPWGTYVNLFKSKNFLIKEIRIKPKGILSLQKHNFRSEHWLITKNNIIITLDKKKYLRKPLDHVFVPIKTLHRIQNPGIHSATIMEAQLGKILKENDIVRFEDKYGRS
jgi:mannose-1-phosphate guanylyltransferase